MSTTKDRAAEIAQLITDNYFASYEEPSEEAKVVLFANAYHLIVRELETMKLPPKCPDCGTDNGIISSTQDSYGSVELQRCKNRAFHRATQ